MEAQEIIVAADEPADAGGYSADDELGIVWVSDFGSDQWRHFDGLDEGEEFFFDQASYFRVRKLEFWIGQHSNVFVKYWGRYDWPKAEGGRIARLRQAVTVGRRRGARK
jgi:hypothetical protein